MAAIKARLFQRISPHGGNRQEGCPANTGTLQKRHTRLAVCIGIHNDILHSTAQSDLNGYCIRILGTDQSGDRSVNIAKSPPVCLLEHSAYRFLKAFVIPLHCPEHPQLCLHTVQFGGEVSMLLIKLISALDPCRLTQGVACDGIIGCRHILLGAAQLFLTILQILPCFLLPGISRGKIREQLIHSLLGLRDALLQTADIRLCAGKVGSQCAFLGTQLQKLPVVTLSAGAQSRQLLL